MVSVNYTKVAGIGETLSSKSFHNIMHRYGMLASKLKGLNFITIIIAKTQGCNNYLLTF